MTLKLDNSIPKDPYTKQLWKPMSRNNGHLRSDDGHTDTHTDRHTPIPLIDSAHPVGWAE